MSEGRDCEACHHRIAGCRCGVRRPIQLTANSGCAWCEGRGVIPMRDAIGRKLCMCVRGRAVPGEPEWFHPCPHCGEPVDCGDRADGARLTCKSCQKRAYFIHVHEQRPDDDCVPECFEKSHWRLAKSKQRRGAR